MFPVDHLSASSINLFIRCPRQWQERYIYKREGGSSSSLIIGSATHLALSKLLKGEIFDPAVIWAEVLAEESLIDWTDPPDRAFNTFVKNVYDYYELVGKHLDVLETEKEVLIDIPGIPIPVLGYVDIVTPDRIIDVKTTRYMSAKGVKLNPEWKLQAEIYQLAYPHPAEFHVVTRSKTEPIVLPASSRHPLFVPVKSSASTKNFVRQIYLEMEWMVSTFGDTPFRGNVNHQWAGKYCSVENCCAR